MIDLQTLLRFLRERWFAEAAYFAALRALESDSPEDFVLAGLACCGVDVSDPETRRFAQPEDRELSPRERELFEDTTFIRPVDTGAGRTRKPWTMPARQQQAQALAGHASLDAHQRYLNNTAKMAEVPVAALPSIRVLPQLVANTNAAKP